MGGGKRPNLLNELKVLDRQFASLRVRIERLRSYKIFLERSSDEAIDAECQRIEKRLEQLSHTAKELYPDNPKEQRKHQASERRRLKAALKEYHFLRGE